MSFNSNVKQSKTVRDFINIYVGVWKMNPNGFEFPTFPDTFESNSNSLPSLVIWCLNLKLVASELVSVYPTNISVTSADSSVDFIIDYLDEVNKDKGIPFEPLTIRRMLAQAAKTLENIISDLNFNSKLLKKE